MGKIEGYQHHGYTVAVDSDLKGKHREHCLCYRCGRFKPGDSENNCRIATILYALCRTFGLTLPVYECPAYLIPVEAPAKVEVKGDANGHSTGS